MPYLLPKELSIEFKTSLQTIYNYIRKPWNHIRTRKEGGKTYIHQEDFKTAFQPHLKELENRFKVESKISTESDFQKFKEGFKVVENEKIELAEKNIQLNKFNLALEDKVSKYALLLSEEKEEKRQFISQNESLQKELRDKIELFGNEKVNWARKYYFAIGVSVILFIAILVLLFTFVKPLLG